MRDEYANASAAHESRAWEWTGACPRPGLARGSPAPLIRTLLLHTGGRFWVDVTGIEGMRDHALLRWVPRSPRVELGLLPSALSSLPLLSDEWGRRVSHFMLDLSPPGPSPFGESGQLAVAVAALWYRHAAMADLPLVRAGADPAPARPMMVLTGSGTLRPQRTSHGLFGYRVEPVRGWQDKLRHLGAALRENPCAEVHLLCPRSQLVQVRSALLWILSDHVLPGRSAEHVIHRDRVGKVVDIWLHPVATLGDIAGVVDALAASLVRPSADAERAVRARARTTTRARAPRVTSPRGLEARSGESGAGPPAAGGAAPGDACGNPRCRPVGQTARQVIRTATMQAISQALRMTASLGGGLMMLLVIAPVLLVICWLSGIL